ncbi:MAG: hypothetical protein ACR2NM_04245 [Bythopirellula sp.]
MLKSARTSFVAWLSQIVRLQAYNRSRKRTRRRTRSVDLVTLDVQTSDVVSDENLPDPTKCMTAEQNLFDDELMHALNDLPTKKNRRAIFAVLAASIAWAIVGWKFYLQSDDDGYQQVALADIYQKCVADGFRPKWVCDDDREFAETFQRRQGKPLLLKPAAKDLMVGLSYLKGITSRTTTMLARVDGEPILVFVDILQRDSKPAKPAWSSGLNLFRQELAGLVLYEVTPLDQPRVLANFYIPESTELPTGNAEKNSDDSP